jgi:hypothetical protein
MKPSMLKKLLLRNYSVLLFAFLFFSSFHSSFRPGARLIRKPIIPEQENIVKKTPELPRSSPFSFALNTIKKSHLLHAQVIRWNIAKDKYLRRQKTIPKWQRPERIPRNVSTTKVAAKPQKAPLMKRPPLKGKPVQIPITAENITEMFFVLVENLAELPGEGQHMYFKNYLTKLDSKYNLINRLSPEDLGYFFSRFPWTKHPEDLHLLLMQELLYRRRYFTCQGLIPMIQSAPSSLKTLLLKFVSHRIVDRKNYSLLKPLYASYEWRVALKYLDPYLNDPMVTYSLKEFKQVLQHQRWRATQTFGMNMKSFDKLLNKTLENAIVINDTVLFRRSGRRPAVSSSPLPPPPHLRSSPQNTNNTRRNTKKRPKYDLVTDEPVTNPRKFYGEFTEYVRSYNPKLERLKAAGDFSEPEDEILREVETRRKEREATPRKP